LQQVGVGNQVKHHPQYTADGSIATSGTPQLVLPRVPSRSFLMLQNLSSGSLWFEFGSARATAALTNNGVSSVTVANAGFNFTKAPLVYFAGGGYGGNSSYLGLNQPGGQAPDSRIGVGAVAVAHCVMTGSAGNLSISSIVVDSPGAGYAIAPYVYITNDANDPYGCAVPSVGSGMLLAANAAPFILNGTSCFTDSIAVFGATAGQGFLCRWMT
jgi:hypothetical protein